MKIFSVSLMVALLWLLLGPVQAQEEADVVAVVVEVSGRAQLELVGQKPVTVEPLMRLYDGATLEVKSGGLVEAYSVVDGRRYEAIGPCSLRIEDKRAVVLEGRADSVRWIESAGKGDLIDPSHAPQRGHQDSKLRLKFSANSSGLRFSWDTQLPGPYWIRVFTAREGHVDKVLWSARTNATSINYAGPELEKDKSYVWQVAADRTLSSARFRVYSGGALDSLQRAETDLQKWGAAHPEDPAVYVLKALMYDQNDEPSKALAALQEAKKRQSADVQQKAIDLRMSQLVHETSGKARSHYNPISPYLIGPGFYGNYNWGYPGWGRYPNWFY